jgi:adenosylhomocysteinase
MINFAAFEIARQKYPRQETPFLSELREIAHSKKIYQGLKILHNIPLTLASILKIETLLLGGANVTVSCISFLSPEQEAIDILKAAQVEVQIEHHFKGEYDFHLDCCGELLHLAPPKIGAIELTQTGSERYKRSSFSYPLVSVDDSVLKYLETFLGTGDGFLRGLIATLGSKIQDQLFVVFGYGKVGKGLVHALTKVTHDIIVIDVNPDAIESAKKKGLTVINGGDIPLVKDTIKNAYCVVTATGIKGILSDFYHFNKSDFAHSLLANMGADDEYGENFNANDVLFKKRPLNFSIPEPTTMKYLDPILYAHNVGIDVVLSQPIKAGYNPFPEQLAQVILQKWATFHHENLLEIAL